jgi:AcrR family transcriptional regulator
MPLERNREKTRKRLIQAVESLLWRKGFKGLGVNAVAREAGVDKVLIYRYFGGLPGLIAAFGREGDFWPSVSELAGGDPEGFSRLTVEAKLSALGRNFLAAMQQRPLTQEIMAWEMVERNELTVELEIIRENIILRFMEMYFPELDTDIDIEAITALMGAGISYLVTRSRNIDQYSGIDLKSKAGWRRLENAMETIVRGVTGLMKAPSNG